MGFGASLVLLTTGVILVARVSADFVGLDVKAIGVVLVLAGLAGLALSMRFRSTFGGPVSIGRRRDE